MIVYGIVFFSFFLHRSRNADQSSKIKIRSASQPKNGMEKRRVKRGNNEISRKKYKTGPLK